MRVVRGDSARKLVTHLFDPPYVRKDGTVFVMSEEDRNPQPVLTKAAGVWYASLRLRDRAQKQPYAVTATGSTPKKAREALRRKLAKSTALDRHASWIKLREAYAAIAVFSNQWIRNRMREQSILRRVLLPTPIEDTELNTNDEPTKVPS